MSRLRDEHCVPCRSKDARALSAAEVRALQAEVPEWTLNAHAGEPRIERVFKFKNFAEALAFTNRVGALAEAEDHHPALLTEYGRVTVSWWTHVVKGLHRNDFVLAARTDGLYAEQA